LEIFLRIPLVFGNGYGGVLLEVGWTRWTGWEEEESAWNEMEGWGVRANERVLLRREVK